MSAAVLQSVEIDVDLRPDVLSEPETGEAIESNRDYHADFSSVSHSSLEVFRKWSPTFFNRYIAKTEPMPPPSEEMRLGTAFHASLLEPENAHIMAGPTNQKTGKMFGSDTNAWRDFEDANPDATILDADQLRRLNGMLAAVRQNDDVVAFLNAPQRREVSLRWTDLDTGVLCKCRPDCLTNSGVIVDFKTSSDPTDWLKQAANFGYHRQAEWYRRGSLAALNLSMLPPFVHVVVGSKPPYAVIVYRLGDRSLDLGCEQNREDLARLAECHRTGDWSDPRQTGIQYCELPGWAFLRKDNY